MDVKNTSRSKVVIISTAQNLVSQNQLFEISVQTLELKGSE
jgi:hypothetical protein